MGHVGGLQYKGRSSLYLSSNMFETRGINEYYEIWAVYIVNGIILECIIKSNLHQAKKSDTEFICDRQITDVGANYETTVQVKSSL